MHGVYYTCETKYGRLSMFFWLLVVIALVALGIFLTVKVSSVDSYNVAKMQKRFSFTSNRPTATGRTTRS